MSLGPEQRTSDIWRYNDERYGKENVEGVYEDVPSEHELADLQEYADRLAHHQASAAEGRLTLAQRLESMRSAARLMRGWPGREINEMYRFEGPGMDNEGMTPVMFRQRDALVDGLRRVRSNSVSAGRTGRAGPLKPRRTLRAPDVTPEDNARNIVRGRLDARQTRGRRPRARATAVSSGKKKTTGNRRGKPKKTAAGPARGTRRR